MAVSVLTFTVSDTEITSGVPEYVEIESNIPANIYYTIDGSTPSIDSALYVGAIYFPTDGTSSYTLKAFGVDADGYYGAVLSQTFAADTTEITVSRLVDGEGLIVDSATETTNREDGFDADGAAVRFIDLDADTIDNLTVRSKMGRAGIEEGTQVVVNIPDPTTTSNPYDDQFQAYSSPRYAETFNPYAKTIVIDNRVDNEVNLTLRPYMSMSNVYTEFGGKRLLDPEGVYVSGGKVRSFYNKNNNVMVSYYFDHNNCQWVRNTQTLPVATKTMGIRTSVGSYPFVFRWISRGRLQSPNI